MAKDTDTNNTTRVVDFSEYRAQKLEEKRRKTERVLINHFLGVYVVTGNDSLHQIEMVDLSEEGCSFQIPVDAKTPWDEGTKDLSVRLYFSQESFLPVHVTIQNKRTVSVQGQRYARFGCSVDTRVSTYPAYMAFVKFLQAYATVSERDSGNVNLFFV